MWRVIAIIVLFASPARADLKPAVVVEQALAGSSSRLELVADSVDVGAVLWADAACDRRFGHPQLVTGPDRAPLLQCLVDANLHAVRWDAGSPIALENDNGSTLVAVALRDRRIAAVGAVAAIAADAQMPTVLDRDVSFLFADAPRAPLHAIVKACQTRSGALANVRVVVPSGEPAFDAALVASVQNHRRHNAIAVGTPPRAMCWIARADEPPGGVPFDDYEPGTAPPTPPQLVPPPVLDALRIAGTTTVAPGELTRLMMRADARDRIVATIQLCVDAGGTVTLAELVKSSRWPTYDAAIRNAAMAWRYRPFVIAGRAVPVCTPETFIYVVDRSRPPA